MEKRFYNGIHRFVIVVLYAFMVRSVYAQTVSGSHNGHGYVDLGLPSGTLWATCNVGAESPEEYGDYYAWGETEAKTFYKKVGRIGLRNTQGPKTSKWCYKSKEQLKKQDVIDDKGNLTKEYDVVSVKWKGEWRMPTKKDIKELLTCKSKWTTLNGVKGREFIGKNGNKLFLPDSGDYWSSSFINTENLAYYLNSYPKGVAMYLNYRYCGQMVRGVLTPNKDIIPKFDSTTPPNLYIHKTLVFTDTDHNNTINADETCSINFEVKNRGKGMARNCVVKIRTKETAQYLSFSEQKIDLIEAGKSKKVSVPIKAGMNTVDGNVTFVVSVDEPNGFGTDEYEIIVPTRAFVAPFVLVQDYAVSTESGSMIKKKQAFDLQLLIQNTKGGNASDVSVSVELPQNVMLMETVGKEKIGMLDGGDTATVTYTLIANNNYQGSTIPIKVNVKEKYGKYAQSKTITLDMNQSIANNKVVVAANVTSNKEIKNVSIGSDVDKDIPQSQAKSPNTFVLIIANENYQNGVDGVPYAKRDGEVFGQYCEKTLGIPKSNIEIYSDATYGNMVRGIGWLQDVVNAYKGSAKVILYYTGHGTPDETTKDAYLVPTDGDPKSSRTLYKLDDLYANLGQMNAKSVTVFLDACFSGSTKSDKMIVATKGMPTVAPKKSTLQGNMVVMSAANGTQTAMVYEDEKHSLFTYYLLKKLKDTKGDVTMSQIFEYVEDQVGKTSVVVNKKSQTPTVQASPKVREEWKEWRMK